MSDLKPCPFCGAEAKVGQRKTRWVDCTGCPATMFQQLEDRDSAERNWNRRADVPGPATADDIKYAIFAMERTERLLLAFADRDRGIHPDDPFAGLWHADDSEAISKGLAVVRRIAARGVPE